MVSEMTLDNLRTLIKTFENVTSTRSDSIQKYDLAVCKRGINQDRVFLVTKETEFEIQGVFQDGEVFITRKQDCRKILRNANDYRKEFVVVKEYLER